MKQYLPFFKAYKKALLISSLLVIADVVFEIVQPALMSRIGEQECKKRMQVKSKTDGMLYRS